MKQQQTPHVYTSDCVKTHLGKMQHACFMYLLQIRRIILLLEDSIRNEKAAVG